MSAIGPLKTRLLTWIVAFSTAFGSGFLSLAQTGRPFAQSQNLTPGKVIERVTCLKDESQSYALYLPSQFAPDRSWPILYGFDPGARGVRPVERFKEAAEKYGYIVVGSNNSRNGPGVPLSQIIAALFEDTRSRFPLDEKLVYATGFSGGARVAGSVAQSLGDRIAGVILCGAGFSPGRPATKPLSFPVFGIAGGEDFNWIELRRLNRALDSVGSVNRFVTFEGDHAWPPSDFCSAAMEWMELQAMKSGRRPRDERRIAEWFDKAVNRARAEDAAKKGYEAFSAYESIAKDFRDLRDTAELSRRAGELRSGKDVKEGLKMERDAETAQDRRSQTFFSMREQLKTGENRSTGMAELKGLISDLRKKAAGEASVDRLVARRSLGLFFVSMMESSTGHRFNKEYREAATDLALAAEIRPENPQVFFALARASALGGDKRTAIESLKKAVDVGFTDADEIIGNPDFASIRNETAFKQLIETAKRKALSPPH
jgi:pimeloyl-ACP methyl ester carboxylesterase